MVLIKVDLPNPVCPAQRQRGVWMSLLAQLTDTDHVELETPLEQFLLNLLGDRVKTDVASWEHRVPLRHGGRHVGGKACYYLSNKVITSQEMSGDNLTTTRWFCGYVKVR